MSTKLERKLLKKQARESAMEEAFDSIEKIFSTPFLSDENDRDINPGKMKKKQGY